MPTAPAVSAFLPREKLIQIARTLPADLEVLSQLGGMLQDVNSELDGIAALLRRDLALAARIVRISNSPMFGGGVRVASVEEAVNRVGFGEILKLVGIASVARFSERALESYGIAAQKLRDNMLYGALAGEALARGARMDTRVAYTAGLLRPLGLMVLDRTVRSAVIAGAPYAAPQWPTYSAWEGERFGIDHCEVGALVLDEWRFPAELIGAIQDHSLTRPEDLQRPLAVLLNLANGLAHQGGRSLPGEDKWWDITAEKICAAELAEEDLEPAIEWTEAAFAAAIAAMAS